MRLTSAYRYKKETLIFAGKAVFLTLSNAEGKHRRMFAADRKHSPQCRISLFGCLGVILLSLTGCHSAYVNATVSNHTAKRNLFSAGRVPKRELRHPDHRPR